VAQIIKRLIFIARAWINHAKENNHKKLIEFLPEKETRPAAIFPEIIHWKKGDEILMLKYNVWSREGRYVGIDNDNHVHLEGYGEIIKVHITFIANGIYKNKRIDYEKSMNLINESQFMSDVKRFHELQLKESKGTKSEIEEFFEDLKSVGK
jgi:hypothetical protein